MLSRRTRLLPLLLVTTGCGARTFISDGQSEEGAPLEVEADSGAGYHFISPEPNSPARATGSPQVNPTPPEMAPVMFNPPGAVDTPPPPVETPAALPPVEPSRPALTPPVDTPPVTPTEEPSVAPEPEVLPGEPEVTPPDVPAAPDTPVATTGGSCEAPQALGSATGTVAVGSNLMASSHVNPSCGASGGSDAVFSWVAPASTVYTFDTFGSEYDTTLTLYTGEGCESEIACNDDTQGVQSRLKYVAEEGEQVTIVVDAFSYGSVGEYSLQIAELVPEECTLVDLGQATGVVDEGQFFAKVETFTQASDCGAGTRRINYLWTAPTTGSYRIHTLGSRFDTVLVLREACGLPLLVCNDDYQELTSSITRAFEEGESVVIELSMFGDDPAAGAPGSSGANSAFTLSIEDPGGTDAGAP